MITVVGEDEEEDGCPMTDVGKNPNSVIPASGWRGSI